MKQIDLFNPNKFVIPVDIKNGDKVQQFKIQSRQHIRISPDQVTESVKFLTNPARGMLVKTDIEV